MHEHLLYHVFQSLLKHLHTHNKCLMWHKNKTSLMKLKKSELIEEINIYKIDIPNFNDLTKPELIKRLWEYNNVELEKIWSQTQLDGSPAMYFLMLQFGAITKNWIKCLELYSEMKEKNILNNR
eukprot:UN33938